MYKVIVVGTDGSDRAGIAVKEAMALAKVSGAGLHAVNSVHPAVAVGFTDSRAGQDQVNSLREEAEKITAQLLAEAEAGEARASPSRSTTRAANPRRRSWRRQRTSLRILSSSATKA